MMSVDILEHAVKFDVGNKFRETHHSASLQWCFNGSCTDIKVSQ